LLVAVFVVAGEVVHGEKVGAMTADRRAYLKNLRLMGTLAVLEALLQRGARGIPPHYEFTLYLHDSNGDALVPFFPKLDFRGAPDPRIFQPGNGATGSAWRDQRIVVVTGTEVANDRYGLTPPQQDYFQQYQSVASAVVWKEHTTRLGVLTALGTEDDGYFSAPGGRDSLQALADVLGTVLTRIPERADLG